MVKSCLERVEEGIGRGYPSAWLRGDTVLWPPGGDAEKAIVEKSVPTAK